jgi:DNA end-binding protein Ku
VKKEDVVMGYETEPGNYVLIEDDELDAVRLTSRHTIELTQFVDIDPLYFERPYYVLPDGDVAEEGYRVIRDALKARRKAAIGQLTLRGKENLVALYAGGAGLVLDTLRYDSEIKDADDIFSGIARTPSRADMLEMAENLIDARGETFESAKFKNHYAEALRDLVQKKLSTGQSIAVDQGEAPRANVLDFMDALKRSLASETAGTSKSAPAAPATKRRRALAKPVTGKAKPTKKAKTRGA